MSDLDNPIPTTHTQQHNASQEPRPDPTPEQDEGESTEFLEQLAGTHADATAYIDAEDIEVLQGVTMTDVYQGETDNNQIRGDAEDLDSLTQLELREGETDDVMVAIEEGISYVPPIDPPIAIDPDDPESIEVAAGFGLTADESDASTGDFDTARTGEDDMTARVRRALLNDASTSHLAGRLHIATINGTVVLRGEVDDLDDTDNIVAVASNVAGVEAIREETTVRGL